MGPSNRLDAYQREHPWLGFPLAVAYKLVDDRGPHLAALVTYYGFVSLFPLVLLFLSIMGFVLDGHPALRERIVNSALDHVPAIGSQLESSITGFHGSGLALAVGVLGTLYGALGAMQAAQTAFNLIYGIPRNRQPNPIRSRLRSLGLVGLLGAAMLVSIGIAAIVATGNGLSSQLGLGLHVLGYIVAFVIDVGLFTMAFQLLTAEDLRVRDVIVGGVVAGAIWELLQTLGSRYIAREAAHGSAFYGTFGTVLAVIAWIYLQSLALMLAAEINVVMRRRLWPRALLTPFTDDVDLTPADRRAYRMYAQAQRFKGTESVSARFDGPPPENSGPHAADDGDSAASGGLEPDAMVSPPARPR